MPRRRHIGMHLRDASVRVNHLGDPIGQEIGRVLPIGAIGQGDRSVLVAQQVEIEGELLLEEQVVRGGIDTDAQHLGIFGGEFGKQILEFPALEGSAGGVRLGIPPQNQEFSPELGQIYQFPVLIGHLEIRRRVSNVQQWHGVFSEKG